MAHSSDPDYDIASDDTVLVPDTAADAGLDALLPATTGGGGELVPYDPLQRYLADVRQHPYLNRDEEHRLALAFRDRGDLEAASRLVLANLRLVVRLAFEYKKTPVALLDLIQEGNLGLMAAVKKFDPDRGVRLGTYASWWIKAYMLRYIMANWKMVKIGTTQDQRKLFFNLLKEQRRLEAEGHDVGPRLLAEALGVKEQSVVAMQQTLTQWDQSLDEPIGTDGEGTTHLDMLAAGGAETDEVLAQRELRELINTHLATFARGLTGRDREIFEQRLVAENPVTLQDIADRHGVSRERIRQNEKRLLERMRAYLAERVEGLEGLDFSIATDA
ncbi:MAG: RNA polymerase factor sigma-32 [Nitrospirae bacterium]|nr:RNA polymerase factor sigma-32 [Nitrospirota bacterium]